MNKSEEIYIKSQLGYFKGKCEVYERILQQAGIIDDPNNRLIKINDILRGVDDN